MAHGAHPGIAWALIALLPFMVSACGGSAPSVSLPATQPAATIQATAATTQGTAAATTAVAPAPPMMMMAPGATRMVTTCAGSGMGSLPDALAAAKANDTITFMQDCTDANAITLTAPLTPTASVTIDATAPAHMVTISGGGMVQLFTVNRDVTLALRGLTLANGKGSGGGGGGAVANAGTVNVSGSTFVGNSAPNSGGAILNAGTLTIVNGTFSGNMAPLGSAVANVGTLNIIGSTFSGNTAAGGEGGGAVYSGGGGMLRLTLSVVAGNTTTKGSADIAGSVTTNGGSNLVGNAAGSTGLGVTGDRLNAPPLLGPLANNGGTVQTFALLPDSPALAIAACPPDPLTMRPLATDARGTARPQGAKCDAGSYQKG